MVIDPQQLDNILSKRESAPGEIYKSATGRKEVPKPIEPRTEALKRIRSFIVDNLGFEITAAQICRTLKLEGDSNYRRNMIQTVRVAMEREGYAFKFKTENGKQTIKCIYTGIKVISSNKKIEEIIKVILKYGENQFTTKQILKSLSFECKDSYLSQLVLKARTIMERRGYLFNSEKRNRTYYWTMEEKRA